jgi:DNA-binding transcriptional LysR family regulator
MHLSRVDLNLFVVFDAIYAEGSITRASQRLNLTQPAVSHALSRLRQVLADPLFVRHGRKMVATPLAHQAIAPVRQALGHFEAALDRASRFEPALAANHFTIGLRNHLEPEILPKLLLAITREAPRISLQSVRGERRELERELAAGRLDAAVDVLLPLSQDVSRRRLASERLAVVSRMNHPKIAEALDLSTYLSQDHIQVSERRQGSSVEDFELSRLGMHRNVRLRCQHYRAACQIVSETDLLLTLPERYAHHMSPLFGIRIWLFPIDIPGFASYLYWHRNADADPANIWLRDMLSQCFETPWA